MTKQKLMSLEESRALDANQKTRWWYYHEAVAGRMPPTHRDYVPVGFFRKDNRDGRSWPVAIWMDGQIKVAQVGSGKPIRFETADVEADFAEKTFQYCCQKPITYDAYEFWIANRRWPPEPVKDAIAASEEIGSNGPPDAILMETIRELRDQADRWLLSIGARITDQEDADKAADFASRFAELEKEADEARLSGRRPHLERAEQVQKTWSPVVEAGHVNKRWAKGLLDDYLKAVRAKKLQEAAAAAAEGKAVSIASLGVKAGTRGRAVSMRSHQEPHVTDLKVLIEHYRNMPRFWEQPAVLAALGAIAGADTRSGQTVPGFEFKTVESVA